MMKKTAYQKRFYRRWVCARGLYRRRIAVGETDLDIFCDRPIDREFVITRISHYRWQIQRYSYKDERFLTTLKPLTIETTAGALVKEMAVQARKAGVGPMAGVAGCIAQFLGKALLRRGAREVIIENGGDIFVKTARPLTIGLYAGKSRLTRKLAIRIRPQDTPLGICTSSGTVGHSFSLGSADSVTVICRNACLADAVATATANRIREKKDLALAIGYARAVRGVRGVVAVLGNDVASWGKIELCAAKTF